MGVVENDPLEVQRQRTSTGISREPLSTPATGFPVAQGTDAGRVQDGPVPPGSAVKWLLAAGLLRKLAAIARSFVANELDLRDWMSQSAVGDFRSKHQDEVWFDYIADTGDDGNVMHALAASFGRGYAPGALGTSHPALPLGDFLFVGGDTAYYISDETTLRQRFVAPLNATSGDAPTPRPIFAIPGNHDYYDHLVGFNRLFRKPFPDGATSVLRLSGYSSTQEASYIKVLLPHGWELWGVDLQGHGLDYRQRTYFRNGGVPERLILCTPTPPVSFNRVLVARDPKDTQRKAYLQLLDPSSELNPAVPTPGFDPAFTPDSDGQQPTRGTCRLHVSGDDHHYARYNGQPPPDGRQPPGPVKATSVATIVSGGGGAFTHPTEHTCGTVASAVKYPSAGVSRGKVAAALLNPYKVIHAGMLHWIGAFLVWMSYWTWPRGVSLTGPALWTGCVSASLLLAGASVALGVRIGQRRSRLGKKARGAHGPRPPRRAPSLLERITNWLRERSVFLPPIGIVAAIALPVVLHPRLPQMDPLSYPSLWMVCATFLVIALGLFAALRGADTLPGAMSKIGFALLGLAHGAMLVVLPHAMVSCGWVMAPVAIVAVMLVFVPLAHVAYRRAPAWVITALWLLQGAGASAVLWWGPWEHVAFSPLTSVLAALVGFIVVPMQFGFYLLTCSAWNGHNNEAGITARITQCKQWIRFHVTKDEVTGYVIGIDDP